MSRFTITKQHVALITSVWTLWGFSCPGLPSGASPFIGVHINLEKKMVGTELKNSFDYHLSYLTQGVNHILPGCISRTLNV